MAELIRQDELIAEMERAVLNRAEGVSTRDVAESLGITLEAASRRIDRWIVAGIMRYGGKRDGRARDGKRTSVPVYVKA